MQPAPRARAVAAAPVDALLARADELARRWAIALILSLPLERIGEFPLESFARQAPLLCAHVVRALQSDVELERIAPGTNGGGEPSPARRLAEVTGVRDGRAAVEAVEALRGVVWEALLEELRWHGFDQSPAREVADLADRLAYVCSSALVSSLLARAPVGERVIAVHLTREQADLYQGVVEEMLARIEESEAGIERRGLVLATMMKLKQVCNHPRQLLRDGSRLEGRSGKLARTEELLEEALAEGDRALVFTQFAEWGALLQSHLEERFGSDVLFLHGGIPKRARDEMVARFQSGSGPSVFILSLKAGGTGLNLTAANQVIHFDRWWNPAVEDQATDRAFRIGQRKGVQVRKLVCVGTLEERIDRMIEQKKELAERIVGSGEGWLTELSTSELREVVELSAEAVAEA